MRTRRRNDAGFTLVELMVVLVIIGIFSGAAMLSWQALFPNQQFNSAVRQLSDVIHGTRSEAIARNREFRIYYNLDDDEYRVRTPYGHGGGFTDSEDDEDHVWVDHVNLRNEGIDLVRVTFDDVEHQEGEWYIRFDPLGAASYHTILLRQEIFNREFTIEALPLTGDIRFYDGDFKRELVDEQDFE